MKWDFQRLHQGSNHKRPEEWTDLALFMPNIKPEKDEILDYNHYYYYYCASHDFGIIYAVAIEWIDSSMTWPVPGMLSDCYSRWWWWFQKELKDEIKVILHDDAFGKCLSKTFRQVGNDADRFKVEFYGTMEWIINRIPFLIMKNSQIRFHPLDMTLNRKNK